MLPKHVIPSLCLVTWWCQLRAGSVSMTHVACRVQGIALSADPNYKVLGAAYPWIARRLLTEQSPELRDTLRTLLYKKGRFQVPLTPQNSLCESQLSISSKQYLVSLWLSLVFFMVASTIHYTQQPAAIVVAVIMLLCRDGALCMHITRLRRLPKLC